MKEAHYSVFILTVNRNVNGVSINQVPRGAHAGSMGIPLSFVKGTALVS